VRVQEKGEPSGSRLPMFASGEEEEEETTGGKKARGSSRKISDYHLIIK